MVSPEHATSFDMIAFAFVAIVYSGLQVFILFRIRRLKKKHSGRKWLEGPDYWNKMIKPDSNNIFHRDLTLEEYGSASVQTSQRSNGQRVSAENF